MGFPEEVESADRIRLPTADPQVPLILPKDLAEKLMRRKAYTSLMPPEPFYGH